MKKVGTAVCLFLFLVGYPFVVRGAGSALTLAQLKNATYTCDNSKYKMENGSYEEGTFKDGNIFLLTFENAAFGELNNDGNMDAAVIFYENTGGSGCFYRLAAMLNKNGSPEHVASANLGDRPVVKAMAIRDGTIILDMLVHGPNDGMANPTVKQIRKYKLAGNRLVPVQ